MSQFQETYLDEEKINQIKCDPHRSIEEKEIMIHEVKRNKSSVQGNSSLKTIFSIANNNFGFSLLVYGINFKDQGLFISILAVIYAWYMGCHSAQIMVRHFKVEETDYPDIVGRVIGKKSKIFYQLTALIYLLFLNILYYIYATDMCYSIINFVLDLNGNSLLAPKSSLTFSEFSYQWIGVIFILLYFAFFQLKSLSFFIKLSPLGLAAVFVITVYSVVMGGLNMEHASDLIKFDFDLKQIAITIGIYTTGFYSHAFLFPVLKNNRVFEENYSNTTIGFNFTCVTYLVAGTFGGIAIAGKESPNAASIYDYFASTWITVVLRLMVFVQLSTVLPIVMFIMRTQFWDAVAPTMPITQTKHNYVNLVYALVSLCLQMFNVSPSSMISLAGALGGFFGIYIFAPIVHFMCIHQQGCQKVQGSKEEEGDLDEDGYTFKDSLDRDQRETLMTNNHVCKSFHEQHSSSAMKYFQYGIHVVFALLGVYILTFKLIDLFS